MPVDLEGGGGGTGEANWVSEVQLVAARGGIATCQPATLNRIGLPAHWKEGEGGANTAKWVSNVLLCEWAARPNEDLAMVATLQA